MVRANRHHIPGCVWHITHRCHKREFLLKFDKDKSAWRKWLFEARKRFGLSILNYTITSNHIHLLVLTKRKMSYRNQFSFSTESIVVGDEAFVTETKKALGAMAIGRSAVGKDTDFQLRESFVPYNALFAFEKDVLRAENRHPWDDNHTIAIV
jgi:hypothetical protein